MNGLATGRTPFVADGRLPSGLTALEASAGTGKTYALSSLAARFVAEQGVPASGLLVVSFTEAATAELRARVRNRLAEAARHLEAVLAGAARHGRPDDPPDDSPHDPPDDSPNDSPDDPVDDPVLHRIATVTADDSTTLGERLTNLTRAVADFDAATITTIHGFCRRVLAGTGSSSGDLDIHDGGLDVDEVVADLFLARFGDVVDTPVRPDRVATAVRMRLAMPDARMYEPDPPKRVVPSQHAHLRDIPVAADLVEQACREVVRRRTVRRYRTFDGLLSDTRDLLRGADGRTTVEALRERLRVVLIDEFQDTDRVQWDIFRSAFVGAPDTAVVLVGDPKQSIYRFRSAEISAYLDAVATAGSEVFSLDTNWRSDAPLLTALETLFTTPEGVPFGFGSSEVAFSPVAPAHDRQHPGLEGAGQASITVRWIEPPGENELSVPAARIRIRRDVVRVVSELLAGHVIVGHGETRRELVAHDIAILTRSNADAASLAVALGEAGVPAATSSSNSVLDTEAARQWRTLLLALERPSSPGRVRAAALGWFLGRSAAEVDTLSDSGLDVLHDLLRNWSDQLSRGGVAALVAEARRGGLYERLLAGAGGERHLTDVDHLAELLLTVTDGRGLGASALLDRMAGFVDGFGDEAVAPELLSRRIDRDDDAVQVLTVHKAKGLEFPIVLCPYLWAVPQSGGLPHAHVDGERRLDTTWLTGANWTFVKPLRNASRDELAGEDLRLLYVALTRARHRSYVWWPGFADPDTKNSLGKVFLAAGGLSGPPTDPTELDVAVGRSRSTIDVVEVTADRHEHAHRTQPGPPAPELDVAACQRVLDPTWRIWSFTAITAVSAQATDTSVPAPAGVTSPEPSGAPVLGGTDEPSLDQLPDDPVTVTTADHGLRHAPGGTAFGTLVHDVLEHCDFAEPDLHGHLLGLCSTALRHRSTRIAPAELAGGLAGAISAPLGGPLGPTCLRDITRADRLDELEFHLPLGRVRAHRIGGVLADHLDTNDPLLPWASGLAAGGFDIDVQGLLTGSIDLVLRAGGRVYVADYKSNQLGRQNPYNLAALVEAMEHHHYPLQAALYLVALHRYLRWRVPDYDPASQLGGAAYLFLRGMNPELAPEQARGVFWWTPGHRAVEALDQLLAGASG
jgi:exodeoxyribonuclease V beta subunit